MIDLSNVTAIALGAEDVLQIQDAFGAVLWQKVIYYNVSISAGSNGSVSVNGVSGDYSQSVAAGTVLTIEGTGTTGYDFDTWSDGNTDNPRTITVTGDLTLTASFAQAVVVNYFYVEDISGANNTLSIVKSNVGAPTVEPYYSTDGTNWTSMGTTDTTAITATIPANGKLYLKCNTNSWGNQNNSYANYITASGDHNVGGNIMSLLYDDNFENTTLDSNYVRQLQRLFYNNTHLIDASDLILPTNTTSICYSYMFSGCTSLTTAPALPATTLVDNCYVSMFSGCTSLTTAPALPATTLAHFCYDNMFRGCTALTTAPSLPATTLIDYCYRSMFYGCTALTTAPALPATTMAASCYNGMFSGCTSLTTAPALPATTLANRCYYQMFEGCTALTSAPATLPATNTASYCCFRMFASCSALTTAPTLHATTLAANCYRQMFDGCSSLNSVTTYANTKDNLNPPLSNWLQNVAATGDFYNLGQLTYIADSASGIPSGWTEHHSLPVPCNVSISAGSNGTVSVNGVSGDYSDTVMSDTVLTLAATADNGYYFTGWSDGNTSASRTITVTADLTLTASFAQVVNFNVSVSAGNNGSVSVDGVSGNYHQSEVPSGTQLTLVATPAAGYQFDSWSDGDTNTTRTVTITADTTLTASFVAAPEYKIKATYYVDSPSTNVHILNSTTGVTSMEIDGVTMSPSTYKVLGSTQTDYKSVWFTLSSSTVDVGSMFVNIEKLSSITIGENITGIAKTGVTLNNYVWFKTVLVESGNTVFDERGWGCVETATNTLVLGGGATTIDATVTTIGEKALAGVAYRTNMSGSSMDYLNWTIPATVTAIGDNAFWGTPKINTLNLYGRPTVGTNALEHFGDNNSTLHIVTGTSIAGTVWKTELVDNRQTGYVWTICADL